MPRLDPTLDVVFKLLLTRKPALLRDMLQGILARPIRDLTIENPGIPGELPSDKQVVLDIRVVLDDGSRADIEMQRRILPALASRLVYYGARDYADQLRRGEKYHLLTPTVVIAWLVKPLLPTLDRLHSIFELRERHTHTLLCDQLSIHLLQLPFSSSLSHSNATGYTATVERWARFFIAKTDAEFDQLASEDPIMSTATQTLDQLSEDPAVRRLAREREDSLELYEMHLAASRAEGEAEGRAEGEAEGRAEGEAKGRVEGEAKLLLKLLGLRFDNVPDSTRAQVEAAGPEQLETWAERVLTAETLAEIFAP